VVHRPTTRLTPRTVGAPVVTGALAGALVGALVTALVLAASPAQARIGAIPVACSTDKVVLDIDDADYELSGTCGVVEIIASGTHVTMPAAQRLVIRGTGNVVEAKPIDTLLVRGHDNAVTLPSARVVEVTSPGSVVRAEGLLEDVSLGRKRATVTADQVTELQASGRGHDVSARRGYDARVPGDGNVLVFRRLDSVVLRGDRNAVTVTRGATEVRDSGTANRVRVNRLG
jgi:hypothetical protein